MKAIESKEFWELESFDSEKIESIVDAFTNYADDRYFEVEDHAEYEEENYYAFFEEHYEEFVEWACEDEIVSEAEKLFLLSSEGKELAGNIIEKVTGEYNMIVANRD